MPPKTRRSKRLHAAIMGNAPGTVDASETQSLSAAPVPSSNAALNALPAAPDTAAKDDASVVWTGLSAAFRRLQICSSAIPPLDPIVSSLSDCIGGLSDKDRRRHEYRQLASDLTTIVDSLGQHMVKSNSTQMSQSARNLVNAIQEQINHIDVKQQRRTLSRYAEAAEDEEDLIERYRRIESYFRQIQLDAMMSVWSNTNEQLAIMRLGHLAPAKQARYNSAQAVVVRRRMCTQGTRTSIRKELRDWADSPDSPKVYWLNGMAGTGKTTIAYSFCDELEQSFQLGASFFCSRLLPECRDMSRLVPTIAYQLASFSGAFRSALCDILSGNHDLSSYDLETQFTRLLRDPLRTVQDSVPTNAVIVVDALDELSNNNDARGVLDTLFRHASNLPVRFLVTSRPEHGIRDRMLSRDNQSRRIMYLHDIERSLVQTDIELYLQDELKSICQSQDQIRQLAEQAGSLFIYAATAVRYIIPENLSANHDKRLETMLQMSSDSSGRKHRDIDALYTAILAGTLDSSDLEPEEADDIRLVLYAAVCIKEPLNVKALASLLGLGHERRALSALQPLRSVLYVSESTGIVSTLHASFPDFLLSASRSGIFHCNEARTNGVLAARCFGTMEKMLRFNICDLESSYVFDVDVPNLDDHISQAVPPELVYACRYWGSHLGDANVSEALRDLSEQFMSIRLLFWMEVLSLKRCIGSGEAVLCEAQKWLEIYGASSDTFKLIEDARKFVTAFAANPISRSTPHLYVSALPFWRKEGPVSVQYWKKTRGLVQIDGAVTCGSASALVATWPTDTPVRLIAFSPSGNYFASGSNNGAIRVCDSQTGTVVSGPFEGHTQGVSAIAFSSDGTRMASGSLDCTIRVWTVQSGAPPSGSFEGHTQTVCSVAFSPDGAHIVSGSDDCSIRVWDSCTGVIVAGPFRGHMRAVWAVAFSSDGTRIISGSRDGTIRVWDAQTGAVVSEPFKVSTVRVKSLALSPSGTLAAFAYISGPIDVWDTRTGTRVSGPFGWPTRYLEHVAFSRDGTQVLSVTNVWDQSLPSLNPFYICVWEARTGTFTSGPFEGHTSAIHAAAFSPDGTRIVSGSYDKTIRVWDAQVGIVAPSTSKGHTEPVLLVAFSADGTYVVSCSGVGTFCVWDSQNGLLRFGPFEGDRGLGGLITISSDATRAAQYSIWSENLFIWDAQTGAKLSGPFSIGRTSLVALSPDGTRIASIYHRTIRVWDAQNGSLIFASFKQHASDVLSIAFSPDGARIASGSHRHRIRIWDADTGDPLSGPFQGHTSSVYALAFSPKGNLVASGSADATVCVWDAWAGTMTSGPFRGHAGSVNAVVFSLDSTRVISGSSDCTIRIWNVQTGALMFGPFEGHTDSVISIALSRDGTRIASGSRDTTIRIWDTKLMGSFTKDDWRLDSNGWIINRHDGELLLWVPPGLRSGLHSPQNSTVVCAHGSFKPSFGDSLHGIDWIKCYVG